MTKTKMKKFGDHSCVDETIMVGWSNMLDVHNDVVMLACHGQVLIGLS